MEPSPHLINKRALAAMGWPPALIKSLLGSPDQVTHHKKGFKHWVEHLYARDRVEGKMKLPEFKRVLEARNIRARAAAERKEKIRSFYEDWRDALPAAAAGMFSLNRYAKHRGCSELHKVEIYLLKNQLIELLYKKGYCSGAWIHRLQTEPRKCRECAGDGCNRCGDTGIWSYSRTLEFWCFRFLVQGKTYCWHQPLSTIGFAPVETVPPQEWEGISTEKPVPMPANQFASAKILLRWVFEKAAAEDLAGEQKSDQAEGAEGWLPFDWPAADAARISHQAVDQPTSSV